MSDENEYYAIDKVARKVCDEKIANCTKGLEHSIKINQVEEEQVKMNDTFRVVFEELKEDRKETNKKFDAVKNYLIGILVAVVGFFGSMMIMRIMHIGG